jgi:hypothetical protein
VLSLTALVPGRKLSRFILSGACPPLQSFSRRSSARFGVRLPWGFVLSFTTSARRVHLWRVSHSHPRSALDVSRVLDGLLLLVPGGFVSPHCRVRDLPFRGFPAWPAVPARRRSLPSCRWHFSPAEDCSRSRCPPFRALLQPCVRCLGEELCSPSARSPLGFVLPRVFLHAWESAFTGSPLMTFAAPPSSPWWQPLAFSVLHA